MKTLILNTLVFFFVLHACAQKLSLPQEMVALQASTQRYTLDRSDGALGISSQSSAEKIKSETLNLAIFGTDRRNSNVYGNADMIMILSIDQAVKKVKLSSILRDTYVKIDGKMNKINASFATGGPQLAIKTLNENFNLDIRDFVSIDFEGSARIIDALGGVVINVKKEELPLINTYLNELDPLNGMPADRLSTHGSQKLNGRQTVAYTRIRTVGNNDYERTERQRMVMAALSDKLRSADEEMLPSLVMQILPYMETSMSKLSLLKMGSELVNSTNKTIEPARFPLDKDSKGVIINGIWYLSADLQATTRSLHNFIYKNIKPAE
jgi:polyisoprenyl-teichoic acid--peptidoglycan teichoic acid transferase